MFNCWLFYCIFTHLHQLSSGYFLPEKRVFLPMCTFNRLSVFLYSLWQILKHIINTIPFKPKIRFPCVFILSNVLFSFI